MNLSKSLFKMFSEYIRCELWQFIAVVQNECTSCKQKSIVACSKETNLCRPFCVCTGNPSLMPKTFKLTFGRLPDISGTWNFNCQLYQNFDWQLYQTFDWQLYQNFNCQLYQTFDWQLYQNFDWQLYQNFDWQLYQNFDWYQTA